MNLSSFPSLPCLLLMSLRLIHPFPILLLAKLRNGLNMKKGSKNPPFFIVEFFLSVSVVFYTGMSANSSAALKLSGVVGTPVRGMMLYEYSSCTCSFMKFMFPLVVHSIHGLSR